MENIKTAILAMVITDVNEQIQSADKARIEALNEAKSHKGAMASRYDTFKEEAQYLAGGYATQIRTLGKKLEALNRIKLQPPVVTKGSVYSLIEVENLQLKSKEKYFLLPAGSGKTYDVENETVKVLDITSPMARIFIGVVSGNDVQIKTPKGGSQSFHIISVT